VPDLSTPVINDEADRVLGRIITRYGAATFALLILATFGMSVVNLDVPANHLYKYHKPLDLLSILVVLIPFFIGMNRLFAARLKMGREFVAARRWREAVAALDPFAGRGQRFLDGSGEAHYLLAQAYAGVGQTAKAEAIRAFVLKHRAGIWADKIKSAPPQAGTRPRRRADSKAAAIAVPRDPNGQDKRPRSANRKPRRRF
jgi:hypothetical protein